MRYAPPESVANSILAPLIDPYHTAAYSGVTHHDLQAAVRLRPPEPGFDAKRADCQSAIIDFEQLREVVQVVAAIVGEVDLLPEVEVLGARICCLTAAFPAPDHPGDGCQIRMQIR